MSRRDDWDCRKDACLEMCDELDKDDRTIAALRAQNAGLVRALERWMTRGETHSYNGIRPDCTLDNGKPCRRCETATLLAASRSLASPPGAPAGAELKAPLASAPDGVVEAVSGVLFRRFGLGVAELALATQEICAAIEADRAARPGAPMLDPGTVEACAKICDDTAAMECSTTAAELAKGIRALAAPPPLREAPPDECTCKHCEVVGRQRAEIEARRALQEAPTCAECKGHKGYWEAHGMCGDDDRWVPCPACAPPATERAKP